MATEIELFQPRGTGPELNAPKLWLSDSGLYWYLYPHFARLAKLTGQMIDLYGDAKFAGGDLGILDQALQDVLLELERQPETWEQRTGELMVVVRKLLKEQISKKEVSSFVTQFRDLIAKAIKGRGVITCTGD
jgi:hypothetical protein